MGVKPKTKKADGEPLVVLDPVTKAPPPSRFANAQEVWSVASELIDADDRRSGLRSVIQGLIDGNRPYNPSVLRNNGQGWRANVNFREAEGLIQAQRTPYYDLVMEVDPCVSVPVEYGRGQKAKEWGDIIASEFHRMLFGWDAFDWHVQLRQSEELTFGWGSHLHFDKHDWRVSTKTARNVLFPDRTTSDLEDLEFFVVRDVMKTHKLYGKIRNAEAATKVGWNTEAVKRVIVNASKADDNNRRTSTEDVQSRMKNGDMGFGYSSSREITLNHVFVRELEGGKDGTGGISHYIIAEGGVENDYLFESRNRFGCDWNEVITLYPYDIGSDGTIHSIRGLGARIHPFCELYNRLTNSMVDSVLMNSGILLTQQGQNVDPQRLQLTNIGPMRILPAGVVPAQWKPNDLNQGPIALKRDLEGTMSENTKSYRQTTGDGLDRERTAFEVASNQADSAKLQKAAHNMEYRGLSRQYREQLRRACNLNLTVHHPGGREALEFQRRCMKRGVPKAAFVNIYYAGVEAVRSLGAGSASQRLMATQALMQTVYPAAGPVEKNNILRDYTSALVGQRLVDRYVPEINSNGVPTDDDSVAELENNVLASGGTAVVAANQNHIRHGSRHLMKCAQAVKGLEQGADPKQVLAALEAIGPHVAQHLGYVAADPTQKNEVEALKGKLIEVSRWTDKLRHNVEQMMQAEQEAAAQQQQEQPQQQVDPALAKAAHEAELKEAQAQHNASLKEKEVEAKLKLKDAETAAKITRDNATAAAGAAKRPYKRGGGKE